MDIFMKAASLIVLLILSSCASNRPKELPPFSKETVCSDESLAYLKKNETSKKSQKPTPLKYTTEEIRGRIEKLGPEVKKCYEDELTSLGKDNRFHLCLVTGYDAKGINNFFQFSTKEIQLSDSMKKCLASLKDKLDLKGLKSTDVIQPFNLYPR